ncbi:conserved hypothetical protein [Tenacibaculum maritimum]|uniref:restriction endonuclease subunit S n=1 Tax=Tenacibaculum maritimum TaxID=107401 RepID=UPI0012E4A4DE|nr:restriction endonuclease subunit S [Tenacibaculum maritimum]CAA0144334.1 conserved hypothetical protein [Tenacibaculum maritimum]CAA0166891.1 conserved hypothetical protein [Tenacibaculum maritimum]CAA0170415.1 conserved hypothetical protein [Tenacibaculum maritimum]
MKLDFKNKKWKEFVFEDFFEIDSTSSGIDRNKLINKKGNIPYITRSDKENGYDSFICEQNDKYSTDQSNVITVGLDTQTVFYQPNKFYTGQNIQVLKNDHLTNLVAQFLIPLIRRQMEKFSWGGNGATLTRLRRSKILVPINKKGNPDYEFMEAFMKQKSEEKIKNYQTFLEKRIKKVKNYRKIQPLQEKKWSEFEIGKLFTLSQGKSKGLNHLKKTKEGVNYLGATNQNNGVLCQVEKVEKLLHNGNGIAFIRNGEGSMGYSIYKAEEFIATSDISVGYNSNLNREIGLFITTVADKVRGKYNFGYKRSGNRLKKEKILLPINDQNEPDYTYMENYIKQLEYNKLKEYQEIKMN